MRNGSRDRPRVLGFEGTRPCSLQEDLVFLFRGACERALPAAFRPRGLVAFCASALPAELAAFSPVRAARPVCESALAAAVFAASVDFGFLRTRDEAVAATLRVCFVFFFDAISVEPLNEFLEAALTEALQMVIISNSIRNLPGWSAHHCRVIVTPFGDCSDSVAARRTPD